MKFIRLSEMQIKTTGIESSSKNSKSEAPRDVILYCREQVHNQFKYLNEQLLEKRQVVFVHGPPGTGKSTTTLAFALSDCTRDWVITWIHLDRVFSGTKLKCVRIKGDSIETTKDLSNIPELLELEEEKHLVILDGYVSSQDHGTVLTACLKWYRTGKPENKRLLGVSSMSSMGKVSANAVASLDITTHRVYSWILDEYLEAIQDNHFFNSVKDVLDAGIAQQSAKNVEQPTASDLVRAKFHFAGGSSRMMFSYKTAKVIEFLGEAVGLAHDISAYLYHDVGDQSSVAVNHLLGSLLNPGPPLPGSRTTFIISEYAVLLFAQHMGPAKVLRYAEHLSRLNNPALMGWVFEMFVFSVLKHRPEGVQLTDVKTDESHNWPQATPTLFDPSNVTKSTLVFEKGGWYQPLRWDQGGYDIVFIKINEATQKYRVTFVQVANGKEHDLKLQFMYLLLDQLKDFIEMEDVEIVFLVSNKNKAQFRIKTVTGPGLLVPFGWIQGKEEERCKILALDENWKH